MLALRMVWAAFFVAALAMTALTLSRVDWDGPDRLPLLRIGINYTRDATPFLLVYEVPGTAARNAGVRAGDHIVGLMGKPDLDTALGEVVDAPDGTPVALAFRHRDGSIGETLLKTNSAEVAASLASVGLSATLMRNWTRMILGLGAAIVLIASLLLYRQRRSPVAALLAITALISTVTPTGIVGYDLAVTGAAIGATLTNIAILAFPDGRFATRLARILVLANCAWLGVYFVAPDLHALGIYPSIAISELAVVFRYRKAAAVDRQQIRWAALGFAGAAVFAIAAAIVSAVAYRFNGLLDTIANDMATDALDLGNTLCVWGGLSVALLRFRLYDADVAITRSTVWAVAAPLLAIVFGTLIEVLKVLLGPIFSNDGVAVAIAGVLTASMIQPLAEKLKEIVERWSRARLIALATDLPMAVQDMSVNDDSDRMLAHVCRMAALAVSVDAVAILIRNDDAAWSVGASYGGDQPAIVAWLADRSFTSGCEIEITREDGVFPLRIPIVGRPDGEPEAVGWMVIGHRPDGSIPDKGAIATLLGIGPTIGHGILAIAANRRRQSEIAASLRPGNELMRLSTNRS